MDNPVFCNFLHVTSCVTWLLKLSEPPVQSKEIEPDAIHRFHDSILGSKPEDFTNTDQM